MKCACCQSPGPFRRFTAREMMFGRRECFEYDECIACGSYQICAVPVQLGDYYPPDYYSLELPEGLDHRPSTIRSLAGRLLSGLGGQALTRRLVRRYPFLHWASLGGASRDSRILDIGCGAGVLLRRMRRWGYRNLTGVDPYTKAELREPGLTVRRAELSEVTGEFDLIMLHHVLEHLPDPGSALRMARRLLLAGGAVLVRVPLAGSKLAREFGTDWFNLDAPRHLVIPSRAGLEELAAAAGFAVTHFECDGTEFSQLCSECYRRNVAKHEAPALPGTPAEVRQARRRMAQLNRAGEGDCGLFVLRPA